MGGATDVRNLTTNRPSYRVGPLFAGLHDQIHSSLTSYLLRPRFLEQSDFVIQPMTTTGNTLGGELFSNRLRSLEQIERFNRMYFL